MHGSDRVSAGSINILIADENPILSRAVADLLSASLSLPAEAVRTTTPADLGVMLDEDVDVVILDPLLAGDLTYIVARIESSCRDARLVGYASRPTTELARYCLELGFRAFLPKTMDPAAFVRAIRVVADGGSFIHKNFARQMRPADLDRTAGRVMSAREETILRLAALGHSNRDIAAELAISPKTVDTHRARAMSKLSLNARPELIRMASARGWLL